jgi:hypothetical protein
MIVAISVKNSATNTIEILVEIKALYILIRPIDMITYDNNPMLNK